ncbi:outer envelope protein [Variovorax sp. dw_954]|uniref:outer envelope protein n=1 Tax=Variovorax sp. dw_954 TaxID=2720078 RepID=UPI001BD53785|nr:outer envelope protein [Variovorax sp. dw_954]
MKSKAANGFAGVAIAALAFASSFAHADFLDWSDTSVGYRYGTQFREPFNKQDIAKNVVNFTHADGFKYGTNYLNIDVLKSDSKDSDATETYIVYRNTLDLGKITGNSLALGPVRGLGITSGLDWNHKNDPGYASRKQMLVLGPTFMMDVPGFLNVSVLALWESNEPNSIDKRYYYKTHPALSLAWAIPLGDTNLSFEGYLNWIAPKGKDEFGVNTATETNFDGILWYDAGVPLNWGKNKFRVGLEYQYWRNKFGNPSSVPGSLAKTPQIRAEYHF